MDKPVISTIEPDSKIEIKFNFIANINNNTKIYRLPTTVHWQKYYKQNVTNKNMDRKRWQWL